MRSTPRLLSLLLVAALALIVAACGGDDDAGGEAQTSVTILGNDALAYEPDSLTVAADTEITLTLECGPTVEHDFIIEGFEGDRQIAVCDPGDTDTGTFTIAAGSYDFYCSIPGHRESGMEGTLTVT